MVYMIPQFYKILSTMQLCGTAIYLVFLCHYVVSGG